MERVVIALTDEILGTIATDWVIERARTTPLRVCLVAELEVNATSADAAANLLKLADARIQASSPSTVVDTIEVDRPLLHEMLEQSESADLLVVGSHPDPSIRDGRTPSFPVSLAARSQCPVVIVPDDWKPGAGPVVVGVEALGVSRQSGIFAGREAAASGHDLLMVHTWEPWNSTNIRADQFEHETTLNTVVGRAQEDLTSVQVRGVLVEAVAHEGILANSTGASLVVLGSHGLGRETGLVLGAIHQEVMIRGHVPLCIVPLPDDAREELPAG